MEDLSFDNILGEQEIETLFVEPEDPRKKKIAQFEELLAEDFFIGDKDKKEKCLGLVKYFAEKNFENGFFQGQIKKIIEKLLTYSHHDDKREAVASFIIDLVEAGGFDKIESLKKNQVFH